MNPANPKKTIKGADLFCEALIEQGVEIVFGYPGGVLLPFYDKIQDYEHGFKHILPRHEQGGGFAAEGYARTTGKAGVAIGTSGPGATNLLTSMTNSMMDSIPVVYITGQVVDELVGTDAFQETDIIGMSMSICKHSYFVSDAKQFPRIVKEAFYIALSGRPGPVHVDVTKDAWLQEVKVEELENEMELPGYQLDHLTPTDKEILKLGNLLSKEDCKPVILAGHGVEISDAQKELLEFAEYLNIPVINTLLGLSTFPQDHELWGGMIGMHGDAVSNYLVSEANLMIGIGMRFDDRITGKLPDFLKGKDFVHIDIDPSELHKIVPHALALNGDAKKVMGRAVKLLPKKEFRDWNRHMNEEKQKYGFRDFTNLPEAKEGFLSQPRIIDMLSKKTDGQAIVTADVGRNQMWLARFYNFKTPRSHLSSGGLGTMGFSLPAAMGAKLGNPDREVWAICGDGGFMMNVQEMGTLMEYKIGVKIAIMEDASLGMVRQWQHLLFKGNLSHSTFKNPDFVKLAQSFNIPAWRVSTYEEAEKAMDETRKISGPTLITFMVDPEEYVFPMVPPNTALQNQALTIKDLDQ